MRCGVFSWELEHVEEAVLLQGQHCLKKKKDHTDLLHPRRNLVLVVAMTQSYHGTLVMFGNAFGLIVQHMSLITLITVFPM